MRIETTMELNGKQVKVSGNYQDNDITEFKIADALTGEPMTGLTEKDEETAMLELMKQNGIDRDDWDEGIDEDYEAFPDHYPYGPDA